jgi:lactate dehydrogenase-like 2-hydroxyacid dehydrogenase
MMKPDILLIEPLSAAVEAELGLIFNVHRYYEGGPLAPAEMDRVRAVATGGGSGLPRTIMDRLPALEIIAINGVGTDAIDLAEAAKRSIRVTTTLDVLTDDVADLAIGLMLACLRKIVAGDRFVRSGLWAQGGVPALGRRVSGRRLGVLGLGRIGRAVATRASAFGMSVSYHSRRPLADVPYAYADNAIELARTSDVMVVATTGGAQSQRLVDARVLEALGPEGVLINVARGSVVDEAALIVALETGALGAAGLDVFDKEPNVPAALLNSDRVVLQPHRGSATVETRAAMAALVLDNLVAHFEGRPLPTPVL